jgi:hypothetical protein
VRADEARQGDEDAVDLGLLFFEEADELVVLLDGFEGLDVDGLAGGAGAVDYAGDAALLLGFDGDDEAVAADGDEVFLGVAVGGERRSAARRDSSMTRCWRSWSLRMRASSGLASSARVPSGRSLRWMDSASG